MNERGSEGGREGVDRFSQLVCFLCGKFESGGRKEGGLENMLAGSRGCRTHRHLTI